MVHYSPSVITASRKNGTKPLIPALEEKRLTEGLSRAAMARKLGISHTMYGFLLSGKRKPGPHVIAGIAANYLDLHASIIEYVFPQKE